MYILGKIDICHRHKKSEIYSSFTTDSEAFVFEVVAELTVADSESLSAFSRFSTM